jgi:tight adherence protein C
MAAFGAPGLAWSVWRLMISAALFGAVLLFVYAIFSQPGRIRMSPQREAAIATGHTDRRTLFEVPVLRPVLWLLLVLAHRLAVPRVKRWLRRTLVAAGSPKYYTAEEVLALAMFFGAALGVLLEAVYLLLFGRFGLIGLGVGLIVGVFLSLYQLQDAAWKRIRRISRRLPYALDLIALAMGAGATFTEAVRTVVRERTDDPFHVELRAMLAEMDLGTTRRQALLSLADRVGLDSLRSIVASVVQAEELGTPLSDVLRDQSALLRLQRSVRAEELAARAGVRILVPCVLLVVAVILTVFGPAIVRVARGGLF